MIIYSSYVDREVLGLPVHVKYTYLPGRVGAAYMVDGSPGYPAEPAEVEIIDVDIKGVSVNEYLTDEQIRELEDVLIDIREEEDS